MCRYPRHAANIHGPRSGSAPSNCSSPCPVRSRGWPTDARTCYLRCCRLRAPMIPHIGIFFKILLQTHHNLRITTHHALDNNSCIFPGSFERLPKNHSADNRIPVYNFGGTHWRLISCCILVGVQRTAKFMFGLSPENNSTKYINIKTNATTQSNTVKLLMLIHAT